MTDLGVALVKGFCGAAGRRAGIYIATEVAYHRVDRIVWLTKEVEGSVGESVEAGVFEGEVATTEPEN